MDMKSSDRDETVQGKQPKADETQTKRRWGPQIVGAMIGAFIFMVLGGLATQLGWQIGQARNIWLWGAVIGGFIGAADSLADAGARLTKSENKLLNVFVSFLGILFMLLIVFGLTSLTARIIALLNI